jgi:MFS family permease
VNRNRAIVFAVAILLAINVLNFYDRNVPAALVEPMRKEFRLNDTQIGLLGSAFIWIYAIVGVPFGRIADTWSRKRLLALGVVIWTALTAFGAFALNYGMLMVSRLGVGVGEAVCAPTATSWIGDLFPADRRSKILALFMLGVPVGQALSQALSAPIAQAWGWRVAMIVAAIPAIVIVPALVRVEEPQRGASEKLAVHQKGSVRDLLGIPSMLWIMASGIFLNFNMYAIALFLTAFLGRVHHFSLARAGTIAGVVYMLGGLLGAFVGGYLGDRIIRYRKDGRMLLAAIFALLGAPAAYVGIIQPIGYAIPAIICMTITFASFNTYYGLVYSSIQDVIPPSQRGMAMAVYFLVMYLCGASFGPVLTGAVSDYMAHRAMLASGAQAMTDAARATGLQQAMLLLPILSILLAIVLYFGSRTIPHDMDRLTSRDVGEAAVAGVRIGS